MADRPLRSRTSGACAGACLHLSLVWPNPPRSCIHGECVDRKRDTRSGVGRRGRVVGARGTHPQPDALGARLLPRLGGAHARHGRPELGPRAPLGAADLAGRRHHRHRLPGLGRARVRRALCRAQRRRAAAVHRPLRLRVEHQRGGLGLLGAAVLRAHAAGQPVHELAHRGRRGHLPAQRAGAAPAAAQALRQHAVHHHAGRGAGAPRGRHHAAPAFPVRLPHAAAAGAALVPAAARRPQHP
ncbi:hypothetical protein D3C71_515370 [compost metagenome]